MNLFQSGNFVLHSGAHSNFKINCNALTDEDWKALASIVSKKFKFGKVWGIPRGGTKLANALLSYITEGRAIIVDDVFTTGNSMEEARRVFGEDSIGVVVFARHTPPLWITPIFKLTIKED